jgi:manganese efflux pump family protein
MIMLNMGNLETIIIALALAIDAFAVSITFGICGKNINIWKILKVALLFGAFQGIMPLIGYYPVALIPFDISHFSPWVAFILLGIIGVHMIVESSKKNEQCDPYKNIFSFKILIASAVATSIDALAAGLSVSLLDSSIFLLSLSAAIITFFGSCTGVVLGKRFGHISEKKMELASGIVLILIGLKILLEPLLT